LGFHTALDVEEVHLIFCDRIPNLGRSTNTSIVYFELSRYHTIRDEIVKKRMEKLKQQQKQHSSNIIVCHLSHCYF